MDIGDMKYLEAPAKVMKLSEAIRIGCEFVEESKLFSGCAIGTGYKALTGRELPTDAKRYANQWEDGFFCAQVLCVADAFKIPKDIVRRVSNMHFTGTPRHHCADWLESQGY
jgi:hypothetical protein